MVMPAKNFVELKPETPKQMRVDSWYWETRAITDPATLRVAPKDVMVFHVTHEDGKPVDKTFSALAYKLQEQLAPLIESGHIFARLVEITWRPRGYATDYTVRLI